MKLRSIFALCSLVSPTVASVLAGPYQTIFLWYTYQLEVDFWGPLNTFTAQGCSGTGAGGSCLFDEFIKHIQRLGQNSPRWKGSTGIGSYLTPDVENARTLLNKANYPNTIEASKLVPEIFSYDTDFTPKYNALFDPIINRIQATRTAMKAAGIDETASVQLARAKQAMSAIADARRAENAAKLIEAFNSRLSQKLPTGSLFTTLFQTVTMGNGETYDELDFDSMLQVAEDDPNVSAALRSEVAGFPSWYALQTPRDGNGISGASHVNAIQTATSYESTLAAPVVCS